MTFTDDDSLRSAFTDADLKRLKEPTTEEWYGPWICMGCGKAYLEGHQCP